MATQVSVVCVHVLVGGGCLRVVVYSLMCVRV